MPPLDSNAAENLVLLLWLDAYVDDAHDMVHSFHELSNALLLLFFIQSLLDARLESTDLVTPARSFLLVHSVRISLISMLLIVDEKVF